ncbi:MAG: FAD binding 3 protein [Magnetococcales bacterium]|nr:FAD binding 3 protein [Magnetococcales bacterium]
MTAWKLALAGCEVLLIEAKTFPRSKPCAGWITCAAMQAMAFDATTYPHLLVPITRVAIGLHDGLHVTHWPNPVSYGILRRELDDFLLQRARAAGAEIWLGRRVDRVELGQDDALVVVGATQVRGKWVVGAGGASCPVARAVGGKSFWQHRTMVASQTSETPIGIRQLENSGLGTGLPVLFPEPEADGYAWYFTKGDHLNIGVGALGGGPAIPMRRQRFLERLQRAGTLDPSWKLAPFIGHSYALWRGLRQPLAGRNHLLVGDAAGLARDFSGEGIGPAVRSGSLAANFILSQPSGDSEANDHTRQLARLQGHGLITKMGGILEKLPQSFRRTLVESLCRSPWLRRRWVLEKAFLG